MAVIAMFLSPLAIGFGAYAIKQARYMFKRLAGAFHVVNGRYTVDTGFYKKNLFISIGLCFAD